MPWTQTQLSETNICKVNIIKIYTDLMKATLCNSVAFQRLLQKTTQYHQYLNNLKLFQEKFKNLMQ